MSLIRTIASSNFYDWLHSVMCAFILKVLVQQKLWRRKTQGNRMRVSSPTERHSGRKPVTYFSMRKKPKTHNALSTHWVQKECETFVKPGRTWDVLDVAVFPLESFASEEIRLQKTTVVCVHVRQYMVKTYVLRWTIKDQLLGSNMSMVLNILHLH